MQDVRKVNKLLTRPSTQLSRATFSFELRFDLGLIIYFITLLFVQKKNVAPGNEDRRGWCWCCLDFSHSYSQCITAKERTGFYRPDLSVLKPALCVFPRLDLVPLYASQQTSRSLSVSLFFCLSHFLSLSLPVKSHIRTLLIAVRARVLQQKSHWCLFLLHEYCHPHIVLL